MLASSLLETTIGLSLTAAIAALGLTCLQSTATLGHGLDRFAAHARSLRQLEQFLDEAVLGADSGLTPEFKLTADGRQATIRVDRDGDGNIDERSREQTTFVLSDDPAPLSQGAAAVDDKPLRLTVVFGRQRMTLIRGLGSESTVQGFDVWGQPTTDPARVARIQFQLGRGQFAGATIGAGS